ncbi:hypothetical protein JCM15765_02440 [Paradesulfitobacterium aromaticivorans]
MAKITKPQIAKIWAMARELDMDKDLVHEFAYNVTKEHSLSGLSVQQAIKVIDAMEALTHKEKAKSIEPKATRASKKQIWKMKQLAKELGWSDNEKRLQGFVKKYAGVDKLEWLTPAQSWRVIEGLKKLLEKTTVDNAQSSRV